MQEKRTAALSDPQENLSTWKSFWNRQGRSVGSPSQKSVTNWFFTTNAWVWVKKCDVNKRWELDGRSRYQNCTCRNWAVVLRHVIARRDRMSPIFAEALGYGKKCDEKNCSESVLDVTISRNYVTVLRYVIAWHDRMWPVFAKTLYHGEPSENRIRSLLGSNSLTRITDTLHYKNDSWTSNVHT